MIVNFEDKHYVIKFEHDTKNGNDRNSTVAKMFEITPEKKKVFMDYGVSYCAKKDRFNRAKGRKVAMTKLLKNFDSHDFKKTCWDYYFNQHSDLDVKLTDYESRLRDLLAQSIGAFLAITDVEDVDAKNAIASEVASALETELFDY